MHRPLLLILLLALAALASAAPAPTLLDPSTVVQGQSAADLPAAWWQWAMSAPPDIDPVRDRTGAHCATHQQGPVWFLAGGYGSSAIARQCTVPAGKHVFFPIINMMYYAPAANSGLGCEEASGYARLNNDTALDLFVRIDGVAIDNPKRYRAASRMCFNMLERVPSEQGGYNAFPSATDGYWILLAPLAKGAHTIEFGGRYNNRGEGYGGMVQNIKYVITVK